MEKIGHFILFVAEIILKMAASLAALIALASVGNLFYKIIHGIQSLPVTVKEIIWWFKNVPEIDRLIEDYNTMTAASFNQKYGMEAVNSVMGYLNEIVNYFQAVYVNISEEPINTILATIIVFLIFYLSARLLRFYRQKGQGSFITKFERRAGRLIFNNVERHRS